MIKVKILAIVLLIVAIFISVMPVMAATPPTPTPTPTVITSDDDLDVRILNELLAHQEAADAIQERLLNEALHNQDLIIKNQVLIQKMVTESDIAAEQRSSRDRIISIALGAFVITLVAIILVVNKISNRKSRSVGKIR